MTNAQLNEKALEAAVRAYQVARTEMHTNGSYDRARHLLSRAISAYRAVAHPVVTTIEELDALPNGSVIYPHHYDGGSVILRDSDGTWAVTGHPKPYSTQDIFKGLHGKGALVLWIPEVES